MKCSMPACRAGWIAEAMKDIHDTTCASASGSFAPVIRATIAAADADLARARSEEATATAQLQLRRNEVNQLQRQLSTGEDRR